ncbi:GDSL esterase/lipase At1g28570-like [Cynara cardunculus var. scolymus]|uniref:Lipase, GDSL n=1 Tax=Cynara cardunculus var. scolymus TaxID=59895 RepID=A0A118JXH6_CYNCS|nr:GDSL esterase/lipase At1g28570-like [Cynara cardunculus var. scolymus]KVH97014.1 Lipase, GDSL [Cynara cardunculus var. scolymus]
MANFSPSSFCSSSCITAFIILQLLWSCRLFANGCYTSIISFGDSLADTGNLKMLSAYKPDQESLHFFLPPYGESFFHVPTGRCSNGRLVIDFIAESIGLPLVAPFVGGNRNRLMEFRRGVNYAVVGATALDSSFHAARGVPNPLTNSSLRVQLGWFKQSWPSICAKVQDCDQLIRHSLILMGEIGGNDYNHALLAGKSIDEIETYVPLVVKAIISTVKELIKLGAKTILIPGNLPIGCSAAYLTLYHDSDKAEYDNSTGCLIWLNKLSEYHNQLLQKELYQLRELHRDANIIYGDYYNAAMQFFRYPDKYGFTNGALKACCGGGGPFNYNLSVHCGDPSSNLCAHPDTYVNWDGLHLTQAAYKIIYKSLFQGSYTVPQFNSICPTSMLRPIKELSSAI